MPIFTVKRGTRTPIYRHPDAYFYVKIGIGMRHPSYLVTLAHLLAAWPCPLSRHWHPIKIWMKTTTHSNFIAAILHVAAMIRNMFQMRCVAPPVNYIQLPMARTDCRVLPVLRSRYHVMSLCWFLTMAKVIYLVAFPSLLWIASASTWCMPY